MNRELLKDISKIYEDLDLRERRSLPRRDAMIHDLLIQYPEDSQGGWVSGVFVHYEAIYRHSGVSGGYLLYNKGSMEELLEAVKLGVENSNPLSQHTMGKFYMLGVPETNLRKAFENFKLSAEQGFPTALEEIKVLADELKTLSKELIDHMSESRKLQSMFNGAPVKNENDGVEDASELLREVNLFLKDNNPKSKAELKTLGMAE